MEDLDLDALADWVCTEEGAWLEENGLRYCFCTYDRIQETERE